MVAAKIPASTIPTKNSGSRVRASVGKANYGSILSISGINNLAIKAAKIVNE